VPLPSSLHALALARFESKDTADVYLASPNILTRHTFLEETGDGFRALVVTDIVANDVSVDLHERDGFRARLKQGVRDTNAEALLPGEAESFDAVARAFTDSRGWMVVDSVAIPGERMPASARHRIAAETRAGFLVVAPAGPIQRAGREFVGWWRIDGRTGQTLGVSAEGWGQSAVERAAITIVGVFWLEYLICKGTFLWGQAPESAAVPFPLNLATPLAAMERTPCSVDALVSALVAAGVEIVAVTWPLVLRTIAGRGYSGIFSERPWFATGEGDPGDLPPIFGNPPGRGTPEPDCPPAGQRPSAEPEAAKPSTEPAEPSERPSAGSEESGSAPPSDERMPGYAEDGSGMEAVPPENVDARIPPADRRAAAKERELDEALANHQQAVDESREADLAFERAKARDDQAKKDYRDTDPERLEAAEEWNAANREARAKFDSVASAARQLRRAQYEAEAARYGAGHLRRLAEANRAAYQATQARDEAAAAWRRTGMTDYDSPEYAQFREANERFRQAQRELSDAYWHKESPVRGTDNTVPAPPQPSMPPTERAPVPGGANAPGSAPPPAGCGGGAVSPEAKSVGGAVAAGAGVGAGGGN
jgi:hypothetical protein